MVDRSEYFVSPNGEEWDGSNKFPVSPGGSITGTANVSPYAQSITLSIDVRLVLYFQAPYGTVNQIILTIGTYQHVLYNVGNHCSGGCNNPVCGNPNPFTYTLTSQENTLAANAHKVTLTVSVCGQTLYGGLGVLWPDCTLTQNIPEQYAIGSATLKFILPDGSAAKNMVVNLVDTSENQPVGSQTTNSSGTVSFDNLNVGDTFQATFTYPSFGDMSYSFNLTTTSYSQVVQLTCPSGTTGFCGGECITCGPTFSLNQSNCQCESLVTQTVSGIFTPIIILAGVVLGGLVVYELASYKKGRPEFIPVPEV